MPFGPLDLEISNASIIFDISSKTVWDKKKEEPSKLTQNLPSDLRLRKYVLKLPVWLGIFCWTLGPIVD